MAEEEIKETAAAAEAPVAAAEEVKVKKGKKRIDIQGIACVFASFNNTIVSITDARGNVVAWALRVTPVSRALARALRLLPSSPLKSLPTRLSTSVCAR